LDRQHGGDWSGADDIDIEGVVECLIVRRERGTCNGELLRLRAGGDEEDRQVLIRIECWVGSGNTGDWAVIRDDKPSQPLARAKEVAVTNGDAADVASGNGFGS
jgi:hypothetical protein